MTIRGFARQIIDELKTFSKDSTSKVFDETILLNKKITYHSGTIASTDKEVVYFVFDELRDYYIARRIMQSNIDEQEIHGDSIISKIKSKIKSIREIKAPCEEGIVFYTYIFFKTSSELQTLTKRKYCMMILDFYRVDNDRSRQYQRINHRQDFLNYGLKILFTTGLPLDDFEVEYIQNCLRWCPQEDGGKIFDFMLLGTRIGLPNNLDKYLEILFGLHDKDDICRAFQETISTNFDDFDLPADLVKYHRELATKYPDRAIQIQKIAELFFLFFQLQDENLRRELEDYFFSLPDHETVKKEILAQLKSAVLEES